LGVVSNLESRTNSFTELFPFAAVSTWSEVSSTDSVFMKQRRQNAAIEHIKMSIPPPAPAIMGHNDDEEEDLDDEDEI